MRLSDRPEYREAVAPHLQLAEPGACLRIGGEDLDDTLVPLDLAVEQLLDDCGIEPGQTDLLLDFGHLADEGSVGLAARLARFVLPSLHQQPWRSFAVSAGAFPVNLSEVSAFNVAALPRLDWQLYQQLSVQRLRRQLDFSDYAVTHPTLQTGVAFAAPPQIRYSTADAFYVVKGRRTERRGHKQFFDICERLRQELDGQVAPANRSWGDEQFHVAASKAHSEQDGPGNASTWRAIGTSHHIGQVLHDLNRLDVP